MRGFDEKELKVMRHALGIDLWKTPEMLDGAYVSRRNHYCASNPSPEFDLWEGLVADGMAVRTTEMVNGFVYYAVSEDGIAAMERETGEKITIKD